MVSDSPSQPQTEADRGHTQPDCGRKINYFLSTVQKNVMAEASDNNDIILEDFHDVYLNLTLKTTFLLKWLNKECPAAKFVFKVRSPPVLAS